MLDRCRHRGTTQQDTAGEAVQDHALLSPAGLAACSLPALPDRALARQCLHPRGMPPERNRKANWKTADVQGRRRAGRSAMPSGVWPAPLFQRRQPLCRPARRWEGLAKNDLLWPASHSSALRWSKWSRCAVLQGTPRSIPSSHLACQASRCPVNAINLHHILAFCRFFSPSPLDGVRRRKLE